MRSAGRTQWESAVRAALGMWAAVFSRARYRVAGSEPVGTSIGAPDASTEPEH